MIAIEMVKAGRRDIRSAPTRPSILVQTCFQKGLLLLRCGASAVRLCPPLVITREQAEIALSIIEDALVEMEHGTAHRTKRRPRRGRVEAGHWVTDHARRPSPPSGPARGRIRRPGRLVSLNPSTGEPLGSRPHGDARTIRRCVATAQETFSAGGWSQPPSGAKSSARSARPCARRSRTWACSSRSRRARSARRAKAKCRK